MKIIYITIIIIIWTFLANSCASIVAPSGGPRDTIPPTVLNIVPLPKTLNFQGKEISITFSKYMDKSKLADNIFFQPNARLEYSWWGKEVVIKIKDTLKANTTYSLTIASDFADAKGNKMKNSTTMFFSTGSTIDSGQISGKIITDNPAGVYIFCYKLEGMNADTLNPANTKPDYVTQVGSDNTFNFKALKNGKYRLVAIDDKFKDEVYNEGLDRFSAFPSDIDVFQESVRKISTRFGKLIDKEAPYCNNVSMIDGNNVLLSFSEELDINSLIPANFEVTDSATKQNLPVSFVYPSLKQKNDIILEFPKVLKINSKYDIIFKNLKDTSDNAMIDSTKKATLYTGDEAKEKEISSKFFMPFKDSATNIDPEIVFEFVFDGGVKVNSPKDFEFSQQKTDYTVEYDFLKTYQNHLSVKPKKPLEFTKGYLMKFNPKNLNPKLKDTLMQLHFTTAGKKELSNMKGKIKDSTGYTGAYIINVIHQITKKVNTIYISKAGDWVLNGITEGAYKIEVIQDANSNKMYDYGQLYPYKFSENAFFFDKEINVKANWDTDEVNLMVK